MTYHSINYITNSPLKLLSINGLCICKILFLIAISLNVNAQVVTDQSIIKIPDNRTITQALQLYYHIKLTAEQTEFKAKQPPRWLNYLPSLGTTVIATNSGLRALPTLSISANRFITDKKDQYRIEAKIKSIERLNELQYHKDLNAAYLQKEQIKLKMTSIEKQQTLIKLQDKIFQYDSIKFVNAELDPDTFYRSKINLVRQQFSLVQDVQSLNVKILELYQIAKINMQ